MPSLYNRSGIRTTHGPAEHRLPALARHGSLRPALRPPDHDAEHPAAGRPGAAVPPRVLRRALVLGLAGVPPHGAMGACERDDGARPPRVAAARLRAPRRAS